MTDPGEMLALNELTGLVHEYTGTSPNRHGEIRPIPCGCDGFEEAVDLDALVLIHPRHLERGIWEPGECLRDSRVACDECGTGGGGLCPACKAEAEVSRRD